MVNINQLSCGYETELLHSISLELRGGELVALMGRNASGKTTLFRTIAGFLPPKGGSIVVDGIRIDTLPPKQRARFVSYLPQRCDSFLDITAVEVVLMGANPLLGMLESPNDAHLQQAKESLAAVGLEQHALDRFLHLSEGQKQLVYIARTMMAKAPLFLLDEPDSFLDFASKYQIFKNLKNFLIEKNMCCLCSIHDPNLALNVFDRVLLIENNTISSGFSPSNSATEQIGKRFSRLYGQIEVLRHGSNYQIIPKTSNTIVK